MQKQNLNVCFYLLFEKIYWIKVLILTVLAACDDNNDSIIKFQLNCKFAKRTVTPNKSES